MSAPRVLTTMDRGKVEIGAGSFFAQSAVNDINLPAGRIAIAVHGIVGLILIVHSLPLPREREWLAAYRESPLWIGLVTTNGKYNVSGKRDCAGGRRTGLVYPLFS